jgi:hypothetical protein
MNITTVSLLISIIALAVAGLAFYSTQAHQKSGLKLEAYNTVPLQLQAYERLVMLCERIALPNLVGRVSQPQLSAKEMQLLLLESIKQEFEYNSSQQIYVSPVAWNAVRNLRDQNMLIINQVANMLAAEAKATDLNKQLLEVVINQNESPLHAIVLEALNFEAKKLVR